LDAVTRIGIHTRLRLETDGSGGAEVFMARVTNILTPELWLAADREGHFPAMIPGQPVDLVSLAPGPQIVYHSVFVRRLAGLSHDDRSRIFALAWSEAIEPQVRSNVRVDIERVVHLRVPLPIGTADARAHTVNLSATGALLRSELLVNVGQPVLLVIELAPGVAIPAAARVVRAQPMAGKVGLAVQFERISETDRERIATFICREQRLSARETIFAADPEQGRHTDRVRSA
jgi:hypothetical protein